MLLCDFKSLRSFSDGFYRYWTLVFVCSRYSLILDFSVRFCTVLPDLIHLSPFSDGTVWFWTPLFVFWRDRTFFGRYTEVHFRAVLSDFGHLCSFLERYGLTLDTRLVSVFRRNRLLWILASVFDAYHLLLDNLFISNFFHRYRWLYRPISKTFMQMADGDAATEQHMNFFKQLHTQEELWWFNWARRSWW